MHHFDTPSFKWCHQESNRGHKDFQSFALPTELWHQHFYVCNQCFSIAVAKVRKLLELANILAKKNTLKYNAQLNCIVIFSL